MHDAKEITKALSSLMDRPDASRRAQLVKTIAKGAIPGKIRLLGNQVMVVGVGIDRWTLDGDPAGVVFINRDDEEMVWGLSLTCQASEADLPITAVVDDGAGQHLVKFEASGMRRLDLPPVPARSQRLFIITTDKSWTPGTHDQRRLGVCIDVTPTGTFESLLVSRDPERRAKITNEIARESFPGKRRLLGNQTVAAGLSLDHWTQDGIPAGVVYTNYEENEVSPELLFACHASPAELPLALVIEDGRRTREHLFLEPGVQSITLPPVGPHAKRLYIITTNKTWSPGPGDPRVLGVSVNISPTAVLRALKSRPDAYIRVKLAEVIANESFPGKAELLSDMAVAAGLTGDRWTEGTEPAALVVSNAFDRPLSPEVTLMCNAGPDDLPVTITVDDGQEKRDLVFEAPGSMVAPLSPVPHHARRLYMVWASKGWSPGSGDPRKLGVSMSMSPTALLRATLETPEARGREKLADAVASGTLPGTQWEAGGEVTTVGLSTDGWTTNGDPAALLVENRHDHERVFELVLACHADPGALPITATVQGNDEALTVGFEEAGSQVVQLPPVAPGSRALYLVHCPRTWSPGQGDERKLGVRLDQARLSLLGMLRSLLRAGDDATRAWIMDKVLHDDEVQRLEALDGKVTAVGLTGDHWTTDAGPAAVVVNNEGDEELLLDIKLECHAGADDLPLVVVVDDGQERTEVWFKEAGVRTVSLPPMEAGERRLVAVETDHTWSPGTQEDQRQLGVRLTFEV